ncbi:MAG: hypothetical protein AAGD32_12320 [Planctomycetota bacterium]
MKRLFDARYMLCLALFAGCEAAETVVAPPVEAQVAQPLTAQVQAPYVPADPQPQQVTVFALTVIDVTVPAGQISRNEEFWLRFDEQIVDVASSDLLQKNGIRVGVAPLVELVELQDMIQDPGARRTDVLQLEDKFIELPVKDNVIREDLFWFDDQNRVNGRTVENANYHMMVGFRRTPRRTDLLTVSISPGYRETRQNLRWRRGGDREVIEWQANELLYDLNLRTDVAVGQCLVIAPGPDSDRVGSIGSAFLRDIEGPERVERVMVVVPQTVNMNMERIGG